MTAAPDAEPWTGPIHIKGTATIQGSKVEREARPATITWPVPQLNLPAIAAWTGMWCWRCARRALPRNCNRRPYHRPRR